MQKASHVKNAVFLSCVSTTSIRLQSVPQRFVFIHNQPWNLTIKSVIYIAVTLNHFIQWHKFVVRVYFTGIMPALCISFFSKSHTRFIAPQFSSSCSSYHFDWKSSAAYRVWRSPCACICTSLFSLHFGNGFPSLVKALWYISVSSVCVYIHTYRYTEWHCNLPFTY